MFGKHLIRMDGRVAEQKAKRTMIWIHYGFLVIASFDDPATGFTILLCYQWLLSSLVDLELVAAVK